jgi:hypothetical protein
MQAEPMSDIDTRTDTRTDTRPDARPDTRTLTLKMLRERRERLALELASLEQGPPGTMSARELLTWRQRLAELEGRIARWSHE